MKNSKYSPPKSTIADTKHRVKKSLLSFLPGAVELYEYFVTSPLEKRLDEWMMNIGEAIELLHQNLGLELENLQSNEKFVTVVIQTTRVASQNHQKEKLLALRNAIVSSVYYQDISEDLQLIYIRFIDELTPSHLLLLKFFVKFESEIVKLKSYPELFIFFNLHYEYSNALSRDEFKMLISDLSVRGLIRLSPDIDDFDDIYQSSSLLSMQTNDALPRILITHIAKDFIRFISDTDLSKTKIE